MINRNTYGTKFWTKNSKRRDNSDDVDVDRMIILKRILKEYVEWLWTGLTLTQNTEQCHAVVDMIMNLKSSVFQFFDHLRDYHFVKENSAPRS